MNFKNIKLTMLLFSTMMLTACAHVFPPIVGPTAKLGILDENVFTNQNHFAIFQDPIGCKELGVIGTKHQQLFGEFITIPGNKLTTIFNRHIKMHDEYRLFTLSFYAKENENYLLAITYSGNDLIASILKVTQNKNESIKYTPIPIVKRELTEDYWTGSNRHCTDEDLQRKLKNGLLFNKQISSTMITVSRKGSSH